MEDSPNCVYKMMKKAKPYNLLLVSWCCYGEKKGKRANFTQRQRKIRKTGEEGKDIGSVYVKRPAKQTW